MFHCFLLKVQESMSTFSHLLHLLSLTALASSSSLHSFQMLKLFLVSCFAFEIVQMFRSLVSAAWRCPCNVGMHSPGFIRRTSACWPAAEHFQDQPGQNTRWADWGYLDTLHRSQGYGSFKILLGSLWLVSPSSPHEPFQPYFAQHLLV